MAHYELILDVDVNRIRVAKPKPVDMELASASKSKKKQKITWYYNGVTYKYDDDTEDSLYEPAIIKVCFCCINYVMNNCFLFVSVY